MKLNQDINWLIKAHLDPQPTNFTQDIIELLLRNRGLETPEDQATFLNPPHPETIKATDIGISLQSLKQACQRINQAIVHQETIVIYGDYDADGVSATALAWLTLHQLGAQVRPFIPLREEHGYGLSESGVNHILETYQPSLVITVDNGITALDMAARLQNQGIDLIITDHHQPGEALPQAHGLVHSDQVCGTAVAWFLMRQLAEGSRVDSNALLDLVAIGTIADMMPLVGTNRSLAKYGLEALSQSQRPGLLALKQACGIQDNTELSSYHVGFQIGPRINAMGRIGDGLDALRLLCTPNQDKARQLAQTLNQTNKLRQDLTQEGVEKALQICQSFDTDNSILIISDPDFHEGIIGLIAGKLVEAYHKPAIVFAPHDDYWKGSARSVPGINIIELIRQVENMLISAGGHPGAAGLSVSNQKMEKFSQEIQRLARQFDPSLLKKTIEIDCPVPLAHLNLDICDHLERLAPFGIANPRPLFCSKVQVIDHRFIGKDKDHIRLRVTDKSQNQLDAIGFNMAEQFQESVNSLELAYTVNRNEWQGRVSCQLTLKAIKSSG